MITVIIRGQSSKSTGSGARSNHLLLRMQARSSGESIEMPGVPPGVFIACSFPGHSSTIARPQPPDDLFGRSILVIFSNPCRQVRVKTVKLIVFAVVHGTLVRYYPSKAPRSSCPLISKRQKAGCPGLGMGESKVKWQLFV